MKPQDELSRALRQWAEQPGTLSAKQAAGATVRRIATEDGSPAGPRAGRRLGSTRAATRTRGRAAPGVRAAALAGALALGFLLAGREPAPVPRTAPSAPSLLVVRLRSGTSLYVRLPHQTAPPHRARTPEENR